MLSTQVVALALGPLTLLGIVSPAFAQSEGEISLLQPVVIEANNDAADVPSAAAEAAALERHIEVLAECLSLRAPRGHSPGRYDVRLQVPSSELVSQVVEIDSDQSSATRACLAELLRDFSLPGPKSGEVWLTAHFRITGAALATKTSSATNAVPFPPGGVPVPEAVLPAAKAIDLRAERDREEENRPSESGPLAEASTSGEAESATRKRWKLFANLTQSLGQGTFVRDSYARTPAYGYLAGVGGSYQLLPKLILASRFVWTEELTETNRDGGTFPRELLVRDLTVSINSPRLYQEPVTGINFGVGGTLYFPISKSSRAQQRILGIGLRGGLSKTFEKAGPGDFTLGYNLSFLKNFGPASPDNDPGKNPTGELCRPGNRDENGAGTCLTSLATSNYFFVNDFSVSYAVSKWAFTVDLLLWNQVAHYLGNSPLPRDVSGTNDVVIGSSPYANNHVPQNDFTVGTIEVSYALAKNISLAAGLLSFQPIFIQRGSSNKSLRFPFWDFESTADNYSSIFVDVAFNY